MKAKEHIYNLRTNLENVGSQIAKTTDQHLMYMLDEARASLASQKMDKRVNVIQMSQFMDKKAREATPEEIGSIGMSKVLAIDIPKPTAYLNGVAIFTVGSTDGKIAYTQITFSQIRTLIGRKYTSATPKWLILGNTIFLINVKSTSSITARIRGIFDEPYRIIQEQGLYKKLAPFDWEYPLTMKDAKTAYQIALTGDLGWSDTAARAIADQMRKEADAKNTTKILQNALNAKA